MSCWGAVFSRAGSNRFSALYLKLLCLKIAATSVYREHLLGKSGITERWRNRALVGLNLE